MEADLACDCTQFLHKAFIEHLLSNTVMGAGGEYNLSV